MSNSPIQPPPVRAHSSKSDFNRFLPILAGALTGGAVFLAIGCLWVISSRPTKDSVDPTPVIAVLDGPDHMNEAVESAPQPAVKPVEHEQTAAAATEVQTASKGVASKKTVPSKASVSPTIVKPLVESTISHEERLASTHEQKIEESETGIAAVRPSGTGLVGTREAEPSKFVDDGSSARLHEHQLLQILELTAVDVGLDKFPVLKETLDVALKSERSNHKRAERRKRIERGKRKSAADEFTMADINEFHPLLNVADGSHDLYGFPFLRDNACKIHPEHVPVMSEMSVQLRRFPARRPSNPLAAGSRITSDPKFLITQLVTRNKNWHTEEAIPALMQMLQVEDRIIRYALIEILSSIEGRKASIALAKRAKFEFWSPAREVAISELAKRPKDEYRRELLRGLQYPWAPVAQHAAEALVGVNDKQSVEYLVSMLDNEDPNAPFQDGAGNWCQKQLVRVNHMRNCNMCHAPSFASTDKIRGLVPTPGQPLPVIYYNNNVDGDFVRADVTYIRQDFSAMHAVKDAKPWPIRQRFDYFIRSRPLTPTEVATLELKKPDVDFLGSDEPDGSDKQMKKYPQRDSVLYALRRLTGVDLGESTKAWRDYARKGDKVASRF